MLPATPGAYKLLLSGILLVVSSCLQLVKLVCWDADYSCAQQLTVLTLLAEGLELQSFSYHPAFFLAAGPVFFLCLPRSSQSEFHARVHSNENAPAWLTDLARHIPEARWWKPTISNDPILNPRHPGIETGFKKFEKLPSDQQHTKKNAFQSQQPLLPPTASSPNLIRKVQNWKEWACTDGSCHKSHGRQLIGAGSLPVVPP
eukprot:1159113-Pelagomonas_calceolata.AAC.16